MPTFAKLPNGQVISIPDDVTEEELSQLEAMYNDPAQASHTLQDAPAQPAQSPLDSIGRAVGVNARGLLTGAVSIPAMLGDAVAAGSNKYLGTKFPNQSQAVQDLMTKIGLPEPQTWQEKAAMLGSSVAGGAASNAPMNALAQKIAGTPAPLYNAPVPVSPRMQSLQEGVKAGYKVAPNEIAEASGKKGLMKVAEAMGGRTQVESMMRSANENLTNTLARKAAGLPPNAPLTHEVLTSAMDDAYQQGYEPIKQLGKIPAMPSYTQALGDILKEHRGMARSFPGAKADDVANLVQGYRVSSMDAGDTLQAIRGLREGASQAFRQGNNNLGKAHLDLSRALEDNIENYLGNIQAQGTLPANVKNGKLVPLPWASQMLNDFRDARTLIAKQSAVRDAVKEGAGNVNASKLGALFAKKPEYFTDELATIGRFANAAPKLSAPPSTPPSALTGAEGLSLLGSGVASIFGAGPLAGAGAAVPVTRAMLRYGLMSPAGQAMMMPTLNKGVQEIPAMPGMLAGLGSGLYGM